MNNESSKAAISRWSGPVSAHRGRSPKRSVQTLKVNALPLKKEMIMATGRESSYLWQCNVAQGLKAALLVVGITVLGYLGVEIARQAGPLLNAASGYALESRMLNPEALIESREGQSVEGDAMAAALAPLSPTVPVREFEYFPEHYVNGATKIDDQPPTF